jgi:hypothetical protein
MTPESAEAGDSRPSGNVIELPCSSASAQVITRKRPPALAEGKRPPRYLPLLQRAFNAVPPAARLAVGLPLTYIVLTEQRLFGELMLQARAKAGLTQQRLADRLKKPQSFVAKYEGGERRLDVVEFVAVVRALGADPVRILKSLVRRIG